MPDRREFFYKGHRIVACVCEGLGDEPFIGSWSVDSVENRDVAWSCEAPTRFRTSAEALDAAVGSARASVLNSIRRRWLCAVQSTADPGARGRRAASPSAVLSHERARAPPRATHPLTGINA